MSALTLRLTLAASVFLVACAKREVLPPPRLPLSATSPDDFPARPARPAAPTAELPAIATFTLANGLRVLIVERPTDDEVVVRYVAPRGSEDRTFSSLGLSTLAVSALSFASNRVRPALGRPELSAERELSFWTERRASYIAALVRPASLEATLLELSALLQLEALPPASIQAAVSEQLDSLHASVYRQSALARYQALQILYGDEHPLGHPVFGLHGNLERFTVGDVEAQRLAIFAPESSMVVVVGAVTAAEAEPLVRKYLGQLPRGAALPEETLTPAKKSRAETKRVRALLTPGRIAHIAEVFRAPPAGAPDAVAFTLLSLVTGDLYSSRVNMALREQHEETYSVQSSYASDRAEAHFVLETEVQDHSVVPALKAIDVELQRLRTTSITPEELGRAKRQARERTLSQLETSLGTAELLSERFVAGFAVSSDLMRGELERIERTSAEEIRQAAERYLKPEARGLSVAGSLLDFLEPLGGWCDGSLETFVPKRIAKQLR